MKKSDVNAVLKTLGMSTITCSVNYYKTQAVMVDGKRASGISASFYGPMTSSDAHLVRLREVKQNIKEALGAIGLVEEQGRYVLSKTSKSVTYVVFQEFHAPTYSRCNNLDSSYKTIWVRPVFLTEKLA